MSDLPPLDSVSDMMDVSEEGVYNLSYKLKVWKSLPTTYKNDRVAGGFGPIMPLFFFTLFFVPSFSPLYLPSLPLLLKSFPKGLKITSKSCGWIQDFIHSWLEDLLEVVYPRNPIADMMDLDSQGCNKNMFFFLFFPSSPGRGGEDVAKKILK